jgi:hypothetical protein
VEGIVACHRTVIALQFVQLRALARVSKTILIRV